MRKIIYLVLGLSLMIGAGAFFYQRHLSLNAQSSRTVLPNAKSSDFGAPRSARRSAVPSAPKRALFDRALDVLNLIVGVLGIWFSFSGIRMQRAAAKAIAGRDGQ